MTDLSQSQRNTSFYLQRILGSILLLAMATVFLFSGYSKLGPSFDSFQWTFLDLGINSIVVAGMIARLMIGLEFLLGLFLLFHIFLRPFTYPVIIIILLLFIGYLAIVLLQQGNNGNCGCFGDKVIMKPLPAIGKNVLMIAVTLFLMRIYPVKPYKNQEWIAAILGMAALIAPFILQPINAESEPEGMFKPINLSALYTSAPAPQVDLRQGKHIIGFMSLTCPHCKKAAYLLQVIHHQHPEIPMYIVLNGAPALENEFFKETHAQDVPHILLANTPAFLDMAGAYVPAIYWVNNSNIERKSNYYQLDPKYMMEWLQRSNFDN